MGKRDCLLLVEVGGFQKSFLIESLLRQGVDLFVAASHLDEWVLNYLPEDHILKTDTYNSVRLLGDVLAFCEQHPLSLDGIGTFWEHTVTQTADVAAALDLPGTPPGAARRSSSNKLLMRRRCQAFGIAMPAIRVFRGLESLPREMETFSWPAVVKPMFGDDSFGVMKLDKACSLDAVIAECRSSWSPAREAFKNFPDVWLLEEFVPGSLVSADGIVQNGEMQFAGLVEIGMGPEPRFTQCANWLPARLSSDTTKACLGLASRVVAALGLDNCGFHCELRVREGHEPMLIEIAARLPGGLIPQAYARAYGLDLATAMLDIWVGRRAQLHYERNNYITQKGIFPTKAGTVGDIAGLDEAAAIEGVWGLDLITQMGETSVTYPDIPKPLYLYSVEASTAVGRQLLEVQVENGEGASGVKVSDPIQEEIGRIRDFERQKWGAYFAEALRGEGQEHEPTLWWKVSDDDTFQLIHALFPARQPVRVLEAACGSGGSSFLLCDWIAVRSLVFADICDTALRFARTLQPKGLATPTFYAEADIFQLPFKDGAFDLVWNVGTIEHYPVEGIRQIVKELRRVTAKGGWVVLGIPNRNSFAVLKAYLLGTKFGRWILAGIPGYRFDSEILYGNSEIRDLLASEMGPVRTSFAGNCLWASAPDQWVRWTQRIAPQSRFSFLSFFCAHRT